MENHSPTSNRKRFSFLSSDGDDGNMKRRLLVGLLLLVAIIGHFCVIAHRRAKHGGDFNVNREFGRRFLAGQSLYDDGLCFNYMPTAALYWAPLAMVPADVGIVLRYLVAVGCLVFIFRALLRMVDYEHRKLAPHWRGLVGLTMLLGLHYVIRDLDDGGPNIILLAIFVAGIYAAWLGRTAAASLWFGLAIAVKMTPALFVPFFLWKRRWALAAGTTLASVAWIALPAAWMGPQDWWHHQQQWNQMATSLVGESDAQRAENELRVQNQSLVPAVTRFLVAYDADHPLSAGLEWSPVLVHLSPAIAGRVAQAVALVLLALCCWRGRTAAAPRRDSAWLCETSGVLILMLLLSPVTWLQHMVYALPAMLLIVTQSRVLGGLPRGARWMLAAYVVMSLVLNREVLGREAYLVLLSLHMHTACMLILLTLLLWLRPTVPRADSVRDEDAVLSSVDTERVPLRRAG